MGQKIHPVGFRVGVIRGFDSHWYYNKKGYPQAIVIDHKIRETIKKKVSLGNVSRVEIERAANRIKVSVYTARPGAIIGKGGKGIEQLTNDLTHIVNQFEKRPSEQGGKTIVQVTVHEVRQPELDAQLVAENIAQQLERRIGHRRAMRQAMTRAARMNGRGMKIQVSGRLNGAEIARRESDKTGKIPLHTLRADIDYGIAVAHTLTGTIGCKVWIYKGEVLPERRLAHDESEGRRRVRRDTPRREEGEAFGRTREAAAPEVNS